MKDKKHRPEWWPECPYHEIIFTMTREEYVKAVPDERLRTAISGLLMRMGWEVADKMIYDKYMEILEERAGNFYNPNGT